MPPPADVIDARRRRGRPPRDPGGDAPTTRARLLAAAASACIDHGFDGATVADIAARADVSGPAIYNHFGGRVELLVAAARAALGQLGGGPDTTGAGDVVRAFCSPEFASTRRLLSELHLAAQRHREVADLLAAWHGEQADVWVTRVVGSDPAAVKAFFVVLLGCCQLDALTSLPASTADVEALVVRILGPLFQEATA